MTHAHNRYLFPFFVKPRPSLALLKFAAIFILGCVWSSIAFSQSPSSASKTTSSVAVSDTMKDVQRRIAELEKAEASDSTKAELVTLRQALSFFENAGASKSASTRYESQAENAPTVLKELEKELAAPLVEFDKKALLNRSIDEIAPQLEAARAQLEAEKQIRNGVDDDALHRNERRQKIPAELAQLRERLSVLRADNSNKEGVESTLSARWLRLAEKAWLEARQVELDHEIRSYDARRELLRVRKQLAEKRVLQAERQLAVLDSVASSHRVKQAEDARRVAEDQKRKNANAHPAVIAVAEQNELMAAEAADYSERGTSQAVKKQQIDSLLQRLKKSYDGAIEKVERVGLSDAIGLRLRNQRLHLPDARIHERSLKQRRVELGRTQLRRLEIEDVLLDLVDVQREVQRRLAPYVFKSDEERDDVAATVETLLTQQKDDYAPSLAKALDIYFDQILVPLQEAEQALLEVTDEYREFIEERVLWVQSTHPLALSDVVALWGSIHWLLVNPAWPQLLESLGDDLAQHPVLWLLFIFISVGAFTQRRRMLNRLNAAGTRARNKFKARTADTLEATLWSFLLVTPTLIVIWFLGWRIGVYAEGDLTAALAGALEWLALWSVTPLFLYQVVRSNGLGESHFRWSEHVVRLVRRQLRWYLPLGMLVYFLTALTFEQSLGTLRDSFGRLMLLLLMFMTFAIVYRLMHPSRGILKNVLLEQSGGWLDKLRYVWFSLLLAIPLAMAAAEIFGYVYTAISLQKQLFASGSLAVAVILARELSLRWLELTQRRMALDQARRRFAAMSKAREESVGAAEGATATGEIPVPESEINVAAVSAQAQKLVNASVWLTAIIGAFLIWKDVLPAISFLGESQLWSRTVTVAGAAAGETIQQIVPVTVGDGLMALGFLIIAALVSQNIPGLLEIVVLQHLPITPSARYALTTVARYALIIVGILLAFNAIGVGWSKVQWLAAAVTVGLGFGLQEIFANFVSGLIILFERPIRVGDAVTVGDVSGKVTRIQMRATTITDWNRKELIIPNKSFVTGQVINWTLTDTILRVPIRVGVAYGSDPALVARLLVEIASAHPVVLKDPPPTAYFVSFGDSALDFDLRIFVPTADDTFNVRHDLLIGIAQAFRKEGIEIAFPQRDLHIRSVDADVLGKLAPGGSILGESSANPLSPRPT